MPDDSSNNMRQPFRLFQATPSKGKWLDFISRMLNNEPPKHVLLMQRDILTAMEVPSTYNGTQFLQGTSEGGESVGFGSPLSRSNSDATGSPVFAAEFTAVLTELCNDATTTLETETCCVDICLLNAEEKKRKGVQVNADTDRLVLVGDVHGQFMDLQTHIFSHQREVMLAAQDAENIATVTDYRYLFLGDYVDRGPHGVESIMLLLALKVEYPTMIYLIRGNHEESQTCRIYGFLQECKNKLDANAWTKFTSVFTVLPLAAAVYRQEQQNTVLFCCHGGLSPQLTTIPSLQFINRAEYGHQFLSSEETEMVDGLLWSDPSDHEEAFRHNQRGCGHTFNEEATEKFIRDNEGVVLVVRAHQMVMEGYQWEHNGKLLTLFSAPNYCNINNNKGAIAVLDVNHKPLASDVPQSALLNLIGMSFKVYDSAPASPCRLFGDAKLQLPMPLPPAEFDDIPASPQVAPKQQMGGGE